MSRLIEVISELQRTEKYNLYLLSRVEEELDLLCRLINPDSRTARAFKQTNTWHEIASAAREDARAYNAGVYQAITVLVTAAEKAWQRWNKSNQIQLIFSPRV
jgi:hypothetical protein